MRKILAQKRVANGPSRLAGDPSELSALVQLSASLVDEMTKPSQLSVVLFSRMLDSLALPPKRPDQSKSKSVA